MKISLSSISVVRAFFMRKKISRPSTGLLLAIFIDRCSHYRQPFFENDGFITGNKRYQRIYTIFVDDVRPILFSVACSQFQLSTNCPQLRLTSLHCVPIRTAIFTLCQHFCNIGSTKPPFGRLLVPSGSLGDVVKKRMDVLITLQFSTENISCYNNLIKKFQVKLQTHSISEKQNKSPTIKTPIILTLIQ